MKTKSTARKAEGLGTSEKLKAETLKAEIETQSVPQLTGEQRYLESVMGFARGLKCSRDREIARAARDWESTLDFRIRMTMQERKRRATSRGQGSEVRGRNGQRLNALRIVVSASPTSPPAPLPHRMAERVAPGRSGEGARKGVISSPSGVHIRVGVSPNRD
jgi:hypothetical protein